MTEEEHQRTQGRGRWPPRGLAGWLVRRFVPPDADPKSPETRIKLGMLEGWTSTALSVLLSAAKLLLGVFTGSISVLADGVNNLADVGSSAIIALGFRWSRKPRDREHPFGHGRIETVTALVLSTVLVMVGLDVAGESVRRLMRPEPILGTWPVIAVLGVTIVVKEWLAAFARRLAHATESPVLEADSWNHHFDVLSTSVVVIALIGSRFELHSIDGWAGLFVSLFIIYTGVKFARQSINTLLGEAPKESELQAIAQAAMSEAGVRGVHDIILHKYGDLRLASLHIEVDARRTALDVHDLAERVEVAVGRAASCDTIVHVDPVNRDHPRYAEILDIVGALVKSDARVMGFHDLRVDGDAGDVMISVDLVVRIDVKADAYDSVRARAGAFVQARAHDVTKMQVGIESGYGGALETHAG